MNRHSYPGFRGPGAEALEIVPDLGMEHLGGAGAVEREEARGFVAGQDLVGRRDALLKNDPGGFHPVVARGRVGVAVGAARQGRRRLEVEEVRPVGNQAVGHTPVKIMEPGQVSELAPSPLSFSN